MDYIFTFLWSMAPVCELRCAIPLAMESYTIPLVGVKGYGLSWFAVLPIAVLGNIVPGIFWLLALPRIGRVLTSFRNPIGSLLIWRSRRLRESHSERFERYGPLALTALVAVPLPLTGVWTGCLAAWAFDMPFRRAFPPIALGAIIAGIVVTGLTSVGIAVSDLL